MTTNNVTDKLIQLGVTDIDLSHLLENIISEKKKLALEGKEADANQFWVYEQIVDIHKEFTEAFELLKEKKYYQAWCKLEHIEITFIFLKRHFNYGSNEYKLHFIEKSVRNLQAIYPYRIFSSIEIIEKEKKCNICDKIVTIRNHCGHKVGNIYGGEMCVRVVTKCDLMGIALVENPVNKYTVPFTVDPKTNEQVDHYNYDIVDYLMSLLTKVYEPWDLLVRHILIPHDDYNNMGREQYCPCGSAEKYKDCCLLHDGVRGLHYDFIVKEETAKRFLKK